jgi:transcription elongation factor Elf1
MSTCLNCGKKLSCGCQKKTASDGKSVCSSCLTQYNESLKQTPVVRSAPQENTWGKDRYNNLNKFIK